MNRSPHNYRTISLYSQNSPLKPHTLHKIHHMSTKSDKFAQLIFDCASNEGETKSIFFLKGSGKIQKGENRYNKTIKQKLPMITISTALDSPQGNRKNKNEALQFNKTFSIERQTQSIQMYRNDSKSRGQNRKKVSIRGKFPKKQKQPKKQIKLNDIVLGNKTIMNFKPKQEPSHPIHRQRKEQTQIKNKVQKIKFGSFYQSVNLHQICPWGFTEG